MTACELAIVGASCRLPGDVADLDGLWGLLDGERCAVTEIPDDRWTKAAFFSPDRQAAGKAYTFAAGVIDGVDRFDPGFFGMSPREARQVDPQQRLALELAAAAFDDAGLAFDRLAGGGVGVFVGASSTDYADIRQGDPHGGDAYFMTGSALSIVANRISYAFDLHGPSYVVDTACSSSLVALDAARRALADDRVELALVGGVNLLLSPFPFLGFCRAGMLSPGGRCRAFDAAGDGYVRAEGGGFVVLKRLAQARADGDRIHGVVRASGTNADGRTAGLSLPDPSSQRRLLEQVYGDAGLDPDRLVYLEAHGTGTAVGDPAEAASIGEALVGRRRAAPLPVGSIKGNVGHLEPASGMAGLLKAVAVLAHGRIPRSLFFETPNPAIDFDRLGLRVVARTEQLTAGDGALVGVNSFGFGGANAHVVIEAPPAVAAPAAVDRRPPPVILTAHSRDALAREAAAAGAALRAGDAREAYDHAWTRAFRRRFEAHRLVVEADDLETLARGLDDAGGDALGRRGEVVGERPRAAFVFSGNGSQWVGMGRRLLAEDPAFRAVIREVDAAFAGYGDFSIEAVVAEATADDLAATERAQPLLFALQVAIARRLEALGLVPDVVVGHSVGEVAAAHVAGLLSLADAVAVIFHRSRAQGLTRGRGRMMALSLDAEELEALLEPHAGEVELAGVNAPGDYTLAGPEDALAAIAERCTARGRFAKLLDLDYAFHSRAMAPVEDLVEERLAGLRPQPCRCPMISAVTGTRLDAATLARAYWWRNIREPVVFADAFAAVVDDGPVVAVEIGPKPVLAAYMRKVAQARGGRLTVVPALAPGADGPDRLRAMVADAFVAGARVDWSTRFGAPGRVATLPARALDREPYWFPVSGRGLDLVHPAGGHPLLGFRAHETEHRWERDLDLAALDWLGDHRVGEQVVVPAAAFVETALAAAAEAFGTADGTHRLGVTRLDILRPLRLEAGKIGRARVELAALDGRLTIAAAGADARSFAPHATARVERVEAAAEARRPRLAADDADTPVDPARLYARAEHLGLHYGPVFRRLRALRRGDDVVTGDLDRRDDGGFLLAPSAGDAALHALIALLPPEVETAFLPVGFARLELVSAAPITAFTARVVRRHRRSFAADIEWYGVDGRVVARAASARFRVAPHLRAGPPDRLAMALRPRAARGRDGRARPSTGLAVDAAGRAESGERARRRRHYREETAPLLAAAAADYARRALGPAFARSAPRDLGALAQTLGCPSEVRPLLRRLVAMLEEDGRLARDPDGWRLLDTTELPAAEPILRAVVADSPEHAVDALLLARAGDTLAATLQGARASDTERFEDSPAFAHWRHGSPVVGDGRRALLAAVTAVVGAWPEDRPLRVLNVGTGDAAFAHALVERLPVARTTLVHLALTHRARGTLDALVGDRAGVRVEENPLATAEVVAEGDFDLVVANHALHVTRDDEAALGALRLSLAPGGMALIAERQVDRLADLVFDGNPRWLPAPGDVAVLPRVGTAQHWLAALEAAGFEEVRGPDDPAAVVPGEGFVIAAARPAAAAAEAPPEGAPTLTTAGVPAAAADALAARLELVPADAAAAALWWVEPERGGGAAG
ncbi:MAG: acyltransferase domain-containing protein, partial [Alphaproteobacteria bacterium]|nr:acyltransferase domain-containing protein [Alphaproteobacteria bacterium]